MNGNKLGFHSYFAIYLRFSHFCFNGLLLIFIWFISLHTDCFFFFLFTLSTAIFDFQLSTTNNIPTWRKCKYYSVMVFECERLCTSSYLNGLLKHLLVCSITYRVCLLSVEVIRNVRKWVLTKSKKTTEKQIIHTGGVCECMCMYVRVCVCM